MRFHENNFLIYFIPRVFFVWTFLNFLAHYDFNKQKYYNASKNYIFYLQILRGLISKCAFPSEVVRNRLSTVGIALALFSVVFTIASLCCLWCALPVPVEPIVPAVNLLADIGLGFDQELVRFRILLNPEELWLFGFFRSLRLGLKFEFCMAEFCAA